jgi:hypothetical protein
MADGTPCPDADACNGTETCQGGTCTSSGGPAPLDVRALTIRGAALTINGAVAPPGPIAPSATDDVALTVEAGGAPHFTSSLTHPASDPSWVRSKPPALFKYKDGSGSAGGLTLLQLRQKRTGYGLKARGRSDQLRMLQGGAVGARLVVGNQCWAATLACVKKGKALRCVP